MSAAVLPDARALRRRLVRVDVAVSMPSLAVIVVYLQALVGLSGEEWLHFVLACLVYAACSTAITEFARPRLAAPLVRWVEARARGEAPEPEITRQAFRNALMLPRSTMWLVLGSWLAAVAVIAPVAAALGGKHWLGSERILALLLAAFGGGLSTMGFQYFGVKRALEDLRRALALEIGDVATRSALVPRVSLALKLQVAVAGAAAASLVVSFGLVHYRSQRALAEAVAPWQARLATSLAGWAEGGDLDSALAYLVPDRSLMPFATDFELIAAGGAARSELGPALTRHAQGVSEGELASSSHLLAWRGLPDGRVLVVSTPRAALREASGGTPWLIGVVIILLGGLALVLGRLLAEDVARATRELQREAEHIAAGDLSGDATWESEDELGDLARCFDGMRGSLRETVRRVVSTADRVESAADEIASSCEGVGVASADQVRGIHQAAELMAEIRAQVDGVSQSTQALNQSVEESSSSVLELGAASEELNETASILAERVDEVSSSIEQMIRSVTEVGHSTESLSEMASDTSASMEEMASAMRVVDATAQKTAELSRATVATAEVGQTKVSQTIEGMEAIREATDSAELVIRGLGGRTREIGAILDVIDDVADETNLLALNAAIIAAQAGEQGRAFSVVADEIKELADRVLASTKEIGGLISSVQGEGVNAMGAVEAGSRSVASGVELSAEAGISLEEITRASRESGDRIGEIVNAVREQTRAAAHVAGLMERVRAGVEVIRTASGEQGRGSQVIQRSAVTMRDVSQQVHRTTQEQARGFKRIRESVEGVREAVERIHASLQEQSQACSLVHDFLDQVQSRTRSNEESGQRMAEATRGLQAEAAGLRAEVERFRI